MFCSIFLEFSFSDFFKSIQIRINFEFNSIISFNKKNVLCDLVRAEATAFRWPTATVSCPAGKRMLAGGGSCTSMEGKGWCFLYESRPISENQFIVKCDTPESQNVKAEAFVVCE